MRNEVADSGGLIGLSLAPLPYNPCLKKSASMPAYYVLVRLDLPIPKLFSMHKVKMIQVLQFKIGKIVTGRLRIPVVLPDIRLISLLIRGFLALPDDLNEP